VFGSVYAASIVDIGYRETEIPSYVWFNETTKKPDEGKQN
jgi:hypothetical protein